MNSEQNSIKHWWQPSSVVDAVNLQADKNHSVGRPPTITTRVNKNALTGMREELQLPTVGWMDGWLAGWSVGLFSGATNG